MLWLMSIVLKIIDSITDNPVWFCLRKQYRTLLESYLDRWEKIRKRRSKKFQAAEGYLELLIFYSFLTEKWEINLKFLKSSKKFTCIKYIFHFKELNWGWNKTLFLFTIWSLIDSLRWFVNIQSLDKDFHANISSNWNENKWIEIMHVRSIQKEF
jgi:hypothetical protein